MQKLTKETLKTFLDNHPAISPRKLCIEAGLHPEAISHLYNASNRNLTDRMIERLEGVLGRYGW